jgi:acetyltransferase EpsM
MAVPVRFPLINTNEPESLLTALYISEGSLVKKGEIICTLETTKSSVDLQADSSGYLVGINFDTGQLVQAGDILGYIADSPDWVPPQSTYVKIREQEDNPTTEGMRITKPASRLASKYKLDLSQFPPDILITEKTIRDVLIKQKSSDGEFSNLEFDPTAIIIYGGGGHGKSVFELLQAIGGYFIVGFVDDGIPKGKRILDVPVIGDKEVIEKLYFEGARLAVNAVGGIGNIRIRKQVFERLITAGFDFPKLIHPKAFVEKSASLSPGVQIFPNAYIGSEVEVGFGTIINTGAIVSHECVVGDIANISPGAILAGEVHVGEEVLIGMGVTVHLGVKIGKGAKVGNGATIKTDVPEGGIVSAGKIWPE